MEKKCLSPRLDGARIVLKKHEEDLASTMFAYIEKDRERLSRFLPWASFVKTIDDELNYIKQTHKCWNEGLLFDYGIFRKSDNMYMGNIGLHSLQWSFNRCEVGYWILGDFEGCGYMSEALRVLESHVFDSGFHRVEVRCSSANQKSAHVPMACGYFFNGVLKENAIEHSMYRDTYVFSKLSHQYKKDHIQPLTIMDHHFVIDIAKSLPGFFNPKEIDFMRTDLFSQNGFVYRTNDQVVGFIMYFSSQGVGQLSWMGVHPEFHNKGVGTKLLNHLKEEMRNRKCSALIVKTLDETVDESLDVKTYERIRAFYDKNGFKKVPLPASGGFFYAAPTETGPGT